VADIRTEVTHVADLTCRDPSVTAWRMRIQRSTHNYNTTVTNEGNNSKAQPRQLNRFARSQNQTGLVLRARVRDDVTSMQNLRHKKAAMGSSNVTVIVHVGLHVRLGFNIAGFRWIFRRRRWRVWWRRRRRRKGGGLEGE